jgi:hypothetical protein
MVGAPTNYYQSWGVPEGGWSNNPVEFVVLPRVHGLVPFPYVARLRYHWNIGPVSFGTPF